MSRALIKYCLLFMLHNVNTHINSQKISIKISGPYQTLYVSINFLALHNIATVQVTYIIETNKIFKTNRNKHINGLLETASNGQNNPIRAGIHTPQPAMFTKLKPYHPKD